MSEINDQIRSDYRAFFLESAAGQHFMKHLPYLIDLQHEAAEKNPELARDYTQRAKGIREVVNHISSVTVKPKSRKENKVKSPI